MSPKWKNVCNLISSYSIVVYEHEPAYGDHTPYEGLVDKTNSIRHAEWIVLHFSTLGRFKVGNVNKTTYFVMLGS